MADRFSLGGLFGTGIYAPQDGQVPVWSAALQRYVPTAGGGGGYTDEQAQDAVGGILADTGRIDLVYNDGTPSITADLIAASVANSYLANMAADRIKGRANGGGTGVPQDLTPDQVSTILDGATDPFLRTSASGGGGGITELTGDVTAGPGSGAQAATIANDAVSNAKAANMAQATLKGRADGAGTGDPTDLTPDQASTVLDGATDPFLRTSDLPTPGSFDDTRVVGITIDGGGAPITTGVKGYIRVPWTGTITKATLLADQTGSIVIDVWKDVYANYPPTDADSITDSTPPTLSNEITAEDSTLTNWTTSLTAGDVVGFNVDSVTDIERVTLELEVTI